MRSFPETVILEMSPLGSLAREMTEESGTVSKVREEPLSELNKAEQSKTTKKRKMKVRR